MGASRRWAEPTWKLEQLKKWPGQWTFLINSYVDSTLLSPRCMAALLNKRLFACQAAANFGFFEKISQIETKAVPNRFFNRKRL